jgi:hypothetical protein
VILEDDDSDEAGAGNEAEGASGDVDTGRIERDAKSIDASGTVIRAAMLRSQLRDLGLVSSKAWLLLPHRSTPDPHPILPATRSRVENAPKLLVADQKSRKSLLDMAPQLGALRSGNSGRVRW